MRCRVLNVCNEMKLGFVKQLGEQGVEDFVFIMDTFYLLQHRSRGGTGFSRLNVILTSQPALADYTSGISGCRI